MAADAYLLEKADAGEMAPAIRLYGWDRPSITIGYHQRLERAVDIGRLGDTPVVRRPTGGRALLHDDGEITYAVAGHFVHSPSLGSSLHESYRMIAEAIVAFYQELGIEAAVSRRADPVVQQSRPGLQKGCFASVSRYEIIAGTWKTAAGSQRRTRQALLQHGVVRIAPPVRHPAIQDRSPSPPERLFAGFPGSRRELEERLIGRFGEGYTIEPDRRPFSREEEEDIAGRCERFKNLNAGHLSLNSE